MIDIQPVRTSQDTKRFIKFLWDIYDGNPHWVPPLIMDRKKLMDRERNPFYKHADAEFFLARRNGQIVGRIAAIVNHNHNREHDENIGFFGFFECVDDQAVATVLFDAAMGYLRNRGVKAVRGPANPSVNDEYGLLVDGFDQSPTILMPYNPEYYVRLIENYGFRKCKDLYSYHLSQDKVYTDRLERVTGALVERHGITIRGIDMKDFKQDVEIVKKIYNAAWAKNWGAVPMTNDEIDAMAKDMKPIIEPELVIFAESRGETIGFGLSLPDINVALKHNKRGRLLPGLFRLFWHKKEIDTVRIIVLGVLEEYQASGAAILLFHETAKRALSLGYKFGEAGWVLEDNVKMVRAAEFLQGTVNKTYRIYELPVT